LRKEGKSGKWLTKVGGYQAAIAKDDKRFASDTRHDTLLFVFFPRLLDDNGKRLSMNEEYK